MGFTPRLERMLNLKKLAEALSELGEKFRKSSCL